MGLGRIVRKNMMKIESRKAFLHHTLAQTSFNVQICHKGSPGPEKPNLIHYKLHFLHNLT